MVHDLQSAKNSLREELTNARSGMEYYLSVVQALEDALERLNSIGKSSQAAPAKRRGRKPGSSREVSPQLLPVGSDYWLRLVGKEPQTAADLFKSATDTLGFTLSPSQRTKFKQTQMYTLNRLEKERQAIRSSGTGRKRRYILTSD